MASKDSAARFLSNALSFENAISMGLRSGEQGGTASSQAPRWRTSSAARSLLMEGDVVEDVDIAGLKFRRELGFDIGLEASLVH